LVTDEQWVGYLTEVSLMRSWKTITACAAVAMSVAFYGCDRNDRARETTPPPASAPGDAAPAANRDLKVEDLIKDTNKYVGQEVTVVGEVDEVLSPMAFALDEDAPFAAGVDNDVLVFYPKSAELAPLDDAWLNDEVRVIGTVGKMTVSEIEREVGWDLDPKIEVEVEKQGPVLIAKRVERINP
jgi:hypothetical protein